MQKQAKATRKPATAKAAKPSKPVANVSNERNETRERCVANRAIVAPHYNGASLASHASRAPKLADALERIANPIQRAKSATVRDASAAVLCAKHADANGFFCPVAATSDLGTLSRLASLGHIEIADGKARLTKSGRDLATLTAKAA